MSAKAREPSTDAAWGSPEIKALHSAVGCLLGCRDVLKYVSAIARSIADTASRSDTAGVGDAWLVKDLAEAAQYLADDWANTADGEREDGEEVLALAYERTHKA